jgi:hypothetical protein
LDVLNDSLLAVEVYLSLVLLTYFIVCLVHYHLILIIFDQ